MKALALYPGAKEVTLVDRPEPSRTSPDEVRLQVLQVGICGTDREEVSGGRARPPEGRQNLVIGHEMFGRVVETGEAVTRVKPGDYAVFTVRRGCGRCMPCMMNRSDMCETGGYSERGIMGLDGYQTEFVVDKEVHLIPVPPDLKETGVLTEPLSIVEKAIQGAVQVQTARLPHSQASPDWLYGRRCLVAGLGPIGLLAALALRLRGAEVFGMDVVDRETARPRWLAEIGGTYVDGRLLRPDTVADALGPMELVFEAAGIASLAFNLLDALAINGVYVLTGVPEGSRSVQIPGEELMRRLVMNNQIMMGSVNAAPGHFRMAVQDLSVASLRWGKAVERLITHRLDPAGSAEIFHTHKDDEIKVVIRWDGA
ncbi:MAG: glucose 1-dehydrogenase [Alphaproteobacteria bacterium]|uniref:Glucose 1-dehydrogenase n=1 Tax=Candidatus Nitrobium versatile TaxID=2884831 RepID=A0A953LY06_9BACT|nr:glucose 1-dehydrogenase [Candidatus Nitrobium versatile]